MPEIEVQELSDDTIHVFLRFLCDAWDGSSCSGGCVIARVARLHCTALHFIDA